MGRKAELLSERVRSAFSRTGEMSFSKEYLDVLHYNWRNASNNQNRSIFTFIFLGFIFELLTRTSISEVALGPFKIKDLSLIHKLLPIVMAYYFFEVLSWAKERNIITDVYTEVIKTCYPSISKNKLDSYLSPEGITIFGYQNRRLKNKFLYNIQEIIRIPLLLFVGLSPLIVGVYAFYQLFNLFGIEDVLVWLSLVGSILLIILAYTSLGEYTIL